MAAASAEMAVKAALAGNMAAALTAAAVAALNAREAAVAGRCRLTVSKAVLNAPMVSALVT